ncbi:hypothetical protein FDP41_012494 [Naegleria fowleri]|uniref:Probable threonine--tRNA ligase, cytoplasmic n=1 Tax=Naegleria fowleri TaxID=5763 RepID=A0A6A5C4J3_NAEFO|nr:uncharacterized protein FDP41_012494 [Naegleria fowleri]KAF0981384.1 hypothetical protein FDP41_012494 [Naegleria fowleri]
MSQPCAVSFETIDQYFARRNQLFDEFKQRRRNELGDKIGKDITITLPDNSTKPGKAYETTPHDIAMSISAGLAANVVVAKVNGTLWDMGRPLEGDCTLELLKWDAPEAKEVFWHSSSHVMGEALEDVFKCYLCKGPPLEDGGFYYEAYMGDKVVSESDYDKVKEAVTKIVNEKQPFERLLVTKEEALQLFADNKFKVEILSEKVKDGDYCSVYRCGRLIDPCKGPHLLHTGKVTTFEVTKNSSSYWRADASKETLQRVYAMSFPDKKLHKEWQTLMEEAKRRDHRNIGKEQELWFFHPYAPGMVFFLPHGQRLFNTIQSMMRNEYWNRGYSEVQTPNVFHSDLWKTSGHWDKYAENMFVLEIDKAQHSLKPMNCPSHCLMFKHRNRSYRELPIRFADFGVLHRNELKGALTGMTRLRKFQQDDAHIFCRPDQIKQEIMSCLGMMQDIYKIFGFGFKLFLSTRPEKYLGEIEQWNEAERQLEEALNEFGHPWQKNEGDGAFYGPKIDILISDALKREHQCATVQLDFQLPIRFDLTYAAEDKTETRPVIVHRAIFGSLERFLAIATEHFGGKWPFWLSPRQAIVVPVSKKCNEYAEKVHKILHDARFYVDVDLSDNRIDKKIRNAQLAQYNYILVVGPKEIETDSVNIRIRDSDKELGVKTITEVLEEFATNKKEFK